VRTWLGETPDLPTQELLRRAKEKGYAGNKTAFYALVAGLRPARAAPLVRFEGLPAEFSQHDFGHVDVTFVDGRKKRVHFFASRLKYSRYVAVTLVEHERVETIVRCLARDFVAFGGLPLMAVFDRPRTIVKKSGKGRKVEEYNATFAQAIVDIGVGVEMCAPRSGWQKGTVERLVGWAKSSFFKPRKFQDQADLEAQLAAWHVEVNTKTPSRATGVIPETRCRPRQRSWRERCSSTRSACASSPAASRSNTDAAARASRRRRCPSIAPPRSQPSTASAPSSTRSASKC
jgi:transposase